MGALHRTRSSSNRSRASSTRHEGIPNPSLFCPTRARDKSYGRVLAAPTWMCANNTASGQHITNGLPPGLSPAFHFPFRRGGSPVARGATTTRGLAFPKAGGARSRTTAGNVGKSLRAFSDTVQPPPRFHPGTRVPHAHTRKFTPSPIETYCGLHHFTYIGLCLADHRRALLAVQTEIVTCAS